MNGTPPRVTAFVTYESPWFPAGGIAAVMGRLPSAVQEALNLPTIAITPFHNRARDIAALPMKSIGDVQVRYDGDWIPVAVFRYEAGCPWYFLKAQGDSPAGQEPFFDGTRHPFAVPRDRLLRDSLFFGAAAVQSLDVIQPEAEWNLIMQDWEAATVALAFASQTKRRGTLYLTLHNSYDEFASEAALSKVGIDPRRCPGDTILHRVFSLVRWPVTTVSEQFASDFTDDRLQREIMAPHLQEVLSRKQVLGIDNGPFKALVKEVAEKNLLTSAISGDLEPFRRWKSEQRKKARKALNDHTPTAEKQVWGDKDKFRQGDEKDPQHGDRFRQDDSPWFVMAGRDDPRQKGYDVAAAAVEDYLTREHGKAGCAQFMFFPMPGDEGLDGLGFLKTLAEEFPEDVLVFPFRWSEGFSAALRGAAYGLMPSLYEPFGMANEFYLDGACVGIGRATGGNLEQIVPLHAASSFSEAVRVRSARFHSLSAHPTGLLFREKDDIPSARADWAGINEAKYRIGHSPTRVQERRTYSLFQEMVDELRVAIEDGIRVYGHEPDLYYRMVAEGIAHIQRVFSWNRAGQAYARLLK